MNPSFKFFAKAMHDPSVVGLSDRALRGWIFIRCTDVFYDGCLPSDDDLAWYCRIKGRKFRAIAQELIAAGFLERGPDDRLAIIPRKYEQYRLNAVEWAALRSAVFERDGYTCTYCGDRGGRLECDHIHPLSRGGSNEMENLTTACFRCNRSKNTKTLAEWMPEGAI